MSDTWRLQVESRMFVLSVLGEMKQTGKLDLAQADQAQLLTDLLSLYPLERWYGQGFITREQVAAWIAQALALLASTDEGASQ
ncbi:MAG TPA: hypothetical protein VKV40_04375 [Ktedonobacteraceae bacterium]|nr:hypothetical protein [Ktedonobacteraceae bacterium]